MKQMKYVFVLVVLCITNSSFAQSPEKAQMTIALSSPGKPYKLRVDLFRGSIKVTGHSGNNIIMNVETEEEKVNQTKEKTKDGLKKIATTGSIDLSATEKNNEVSITNGNMLLKVNVEIKVPQNGSLVLKTLQNGDVTVNNVKGELEINNVDGNIKLSNIAGSAVANTVNGNVSASLVSVTDGKPMAFSSFSGDVNLTLPASTKANLKMKTDRGEIFSDFEVAVEKNTAPITKTYNGREYKLTKDEWTLGKINGGGAELMIKSWGGNVLIRKVKQ